MSISAAASTFGLRLPRLPGYPHAVLLAGVAIVYNLAEFLGLSENEVFDEIKACDVLPDTARKMEDLWRIPRPGGGGEPAPVPEQHGDDHESGAYPYIGLKAVND